MKISVYIPSYNQGTYLPRAIESVLAQTLPPHQIIIVDDASTDGSRDVIAAYAARHPRLITAIYHDRNQGIPRTRNDGIEAATGDCVTYVDADDRLLPTKLQREAEALASSPDAHIAFSDYIYTDADGANLYRWTTGQKPPAGDVFREVLLRQFPRNNLFRTELVRRRALREVGGYQTKLTMYSDWELRIRLTKRFRTVYVDEPLSEFRRHGAGISYSPVGEHIRAWQQIWRLSRGLLDDLTPEEFAELEVQFAGLIVWKSVTEWPVPSIAERPSSGGPPPSTPPRTDLEELDPHELAVRLQWAEQRLREAEARHFEDSQRVVQVEAKLDQVSQVVTELQSSKTFRRVSWGFPRLRCYVDALESSLEPR